MNKKIEWFQEVLSLEPGSRVFFSLAKIFVQNHDYQDAVQTLRKGLDRHPDFLEARFMLVDILVRLGLHGEAREHMAHITEPLAEHPAFWKLWAQSLKESNPDLAVFLMLVASNLTGSEIRWRDVVLEGLANLSERLVGEPESEVDLAELETPPQAEAVQADSDEARLSAATFHDPEVEELEEAALSARAGGIRTRTMADLLATQGDHAGARDIYAELLDRAVSETDKKVLSERMQAMEARIAEGPGVESTAEAEAEEDVLGSYAKDRLINTLEALAARFEARIRS